MTHHIESRPHSLFDAISDTFEKMAFMDVEKLNGSHAIDGDNSFLGYINFTSPINGRLILQIPTKLIINTASSLYFLEADEISSEVQQDLFNEVLNTITGLYLRHSCSDMADLEMGLPQKYSDKNLPGETDFFQIDDYMVAASVIIQP